MPLAEGCARKATVEEAKACWDSFVEAGVAPSYRNVEKKLIAAGLDASYRTIQRWKKSEWKKPEDSLAAGKKLRAGGLGVRVKKARAQLEIDAATATGDPKATVATIAAELGLPPVKWDENMTMVEGAEGGAKLIFVGVRMVSTRAICRVHVEDERRADPVLMDMVMGTLEKGSNTVKNLVECLEPIEQHRGNTAKDVTPAHTNGHGNGSQLMEAFRAKLRNGEARAA